MSHRPESDASSLHARLRECIADETVSSFARRCQLPEATIRSYLEGKKPVYDKLVKIADAAGVTVDWLATGRGPKRRIDALQVQDNQQDSADLDALAGDAIEEWRAILKLLADLPERESTALRRDLFTRAKTAAELAELRQAVAELRAARKAV